MVTSPASLQQEGACSKGLGSESQGSVFWPKAGLTAVVMTPFGMLEHSD